MVQLISAQFPTRVTVNHILLRATSRPFWTKHGGRGISFHTASCSQHGWIKFCSLSECTRSGSYNFTFFFSIYKRRPAWQINSQLCFIPYTSTTTDKLSKTFVIQAQTFEMETTSWKKLIFWSILKFLFFLDVSKHLDNLVFHKLRMLGDKYKNIFKSGLEVRYPFIALCWDTYWNCPLQSYSMYSCTKQIICSVLPDQIPMVVLCMSPMRYQIGRTSSRLVKLHIQI